MARLFARLIAWLLFRTPVEVLAGSTRLIFDPRSGRLYPAIAGAAGEDDSDDSDSEDDSDDDSEDDDASEESDDDDSSDDSEDDEDDEKDKPSFLKRMSRRHERRAKAEKKRADRLQAELDQARGKKGKDDDSTEEDELKERREALDEERRSFRLEQAVERAARKGLKAEIDGKEKTVKFTDADDALAQIERQISRGDLDRDELFDSDGRVNREALEEALTDLAESKPHLVGAAGNGNRPKGKGDGGKGKGASKTADEMSIEDFDQRLRAKK